MTRNQLATTTLDFSPLFRSMIGFDRLANMLDTQQCATNAYPPYNIEKTGDDAYQISMAVAGFKQDDLEMSVENGTLIVRGKGAKDEAKKYLHRGIATRAFEQRFQLADHVEVKDARLENGMLTVDLVREVPERLKPRKIEVKQGLLDKARELVQ